MFVKPKVNRISKNTSVRLTEHQKSIANMQKKDRNEWINKAVKHFLEWDTFRLTDSSQHDMNGGQPWLDAVEMGIEYKTRSNLLPATQIEFTSEVLEMLETACHIVEKYRPLLKNRGIISGIIRSAIANRLLLGE